MFFTNTLFSKKTYNILLFGSLRREFPLNLLSQGLSPWDAGAELLNAGYTRLSLTYLIGLLMGNFFLVISTKE